MAWEIAIFLVAACALYAGYYFIPLRFRYIGALVLSLGGYFFLFYGQIIQTPTVIVNMGMPQLIPMWIPVFCLLGFVACFSYVCARVVDTASAKWVRRLFLCVAILGILGVFSVCKYSGILERMEMYVPPMMAENNGTPEIIGAQVMVPLGLVFYSMTAVGYVADVYRKKIPAEKNILRYAAFVSFLPTLIQGPINRGADFLPMLKEPKPFDYQNVAGGFFRILWGLGKIFVVSGALSPFTLEVFSSPTLIQGPILVLAVLVFAWQLTYNFSGACDVAIGASAMLGFTVAENFARPFAAKSSTMLWTRWYRSLVMLLRDNVMMPILQSPRVAKASLVAREVVFAVSALVLMVLFSAWHGISPDYLMWGVGIAVVMIMSRLSDKKRQSVADKLPESLVKVRNAMRPFWTYIFFCVPLVFFIAGYFEEPISGWVMRFSTGWDTVLSGGVFAAAESAGLGMKSVLVAAVGVVAVELAEWRGAKTKEGTVSAWARTLPVFVRWPMYYALIAALLLLGNFIDNTIIYMYI